MHVQLYMAHLNNVFCSFISCRLGKKAQPICHVSKATADFKSAAGCDNKMPGYFLATNCTTANSVEGLRKNASQQESLKLAVKFLCRLHNYQLHLHSSPTNDWSSHSVLLASVLSIIVEQVIRSLTDKVSSVS